MLDSHFLRCTVWRYLNIYNNILQSVTVQEGDSFRTETTAKDDIKIIRVYEFTDSGVTVVSKYLICKN